MVTVIASLSFEERCTAFLSLLHPDEPSSVIFLDYGQDATPGDEAEELREESWRRAQALAPEHVQLGRHKVDPYSMSDLEDLLRDCWPDDGSIAFDVSCMTKPHVLALSSVVSDIQRRHWRVWYTVPESYGDLNARGGTRGWLDTLLLPLGPDPSLSNEGLALGVLMLGHEADRALIALEHFEPAAGVVLVATRTDRPDIERATRSRNRLLVDRLERLRMPMGSRLSDHRHYKREWTASSIPMSNLIQSTVEAVRSVVDEARSADAPVVLYPFGPKLAVLIAGLVLGRCYPEASWAVYPVAATHPTDYSDGVLTTMTVSADDVFDI